MLRKACQAESEPSRLRWEILAALVPDRVGDGNRHAKTALRGFCSRQPAAYRAVDAQRAALQPTFLVCQGRGTMKWLQNAYRLTALAGDGLLNRIEESDVSCTVLAFTHPAAHTWGQNAESEYLRGTVEPTIRRALAHHT